MANPAIIVDFIANTDKLAAGFRTAGSESEGFGSKIKGLGKKALVAGGAAGFAALAGAVKIGVDEMTQAATVSAQTGAAIKSTGGVANVTAGHVDKLATSLMKKSGVDDEAITSGENLLLTFTNVRNEVGKGNDVFDQATTAALDMSTALGVDMKTSATQLGKALNNPKEGLSKLTRSGVTFTDQQKDMVKKLQESGDTLGAQKIILGEVNKEFGGSAAAAGKTLPGQINILKESFSNLAGELVQTLVPVLTTITTFFVKNPGIAKAMVIGILGISAAMVGLNVVMAISAVITAPFTGIILGIAAAAAVLIAGGILLYKNWDTVTAALKSAFATIKGAAEDAFNWVKQNWPLLLGILAGPLGIAVTLVIKYWGQIQSITSTVWGAIKSATASVWGAIQGAVSSAAGAVAGAISGAWTAVRNATSTAWGAVRSVVGDVAGDVKSAISALGTWISGWASGTFAAIVSRVGSFFDRIADGARDAVASVKRNMDAIVNAVESIIGRVENAASSVAGAIKRPINAVLSAWNGITLTIPRINIPKLKIGKKTFGGGGFGGESISFPNVPLLAKGGVITSPTLALIGEAGPEAVVPLDRMPAPDVQVRVFIGDQELTSLVRTEITTANTGLARALLAG
jgi:hypothetical protein